MVVDGEVVATVEEFLATAISDPPHILIRSQSEEMLESFEPPDLGVSVLGAADGFSSDGTTAGFVLWMRGRGILVDPPAHSAQYLHKNGISSRKVTHVILTHCHADHDAGTFQKILLEQRVTVMTTKTIMASFVRKYSLVSGMPEDFLLRLFVFHREDPRARPLPGRHDHVLLRAARAAVRRLPRRARRQDDQLLGRHVLRPRRAAEAAGARDHLGGRRQSLLHHGSVRPPTSSSTRPACRRSTRRPPRCCSCRRRRGATSRLIHLSDARAQEAGIEKVRAGFEHTIRVDVPPSPHAHATAILQMLLATDFFARSTSATRSRCCR